MCGLLAIGTPVIARGLEGPFPVYSGDEFQGLQDFAVDTELPNLVPPSGQPSITADEVFDARIWAIAFERGYVLRPEAGEGLVSSDGVFMQPQAAEAWQKLKAAAREAGLQFVVSSAYRSVDCSEMVVQHQAGRNIGSGIGQHPEVVFRAGHFEASQWLRP